MEGSCGPGNELSGSMKGGVFLDYLSITFQGGLCYMKLVGWLVNDMLNHNFKARIGCKCTPLNNQHTTKNSVLLSPLL